MLRRLFLICGSVLLGASLSLADDIRDVKPPVVESSYLLWIVAAIALLVGALLFRRFTGKAKPQEEILSATQKALKDLSSLESAKQGLKMDQYYSRLSDIVRRFMEEQYGIDAPEMTTEEFLTSLKTTEKLSDQTKAMLKEFLTSCDLVKFAKYQPGNSEVERSLTLAKNLFEQPQ